MGLTCTHAYNTHRHTHTDRRVIHPPIGISYSSNWYEHIEIILNQCMVMHHHITMDQVKVINSTPERFDLSMTFSLMGRLCLCVLIDILSIISVVTTLVQIPAVIQTNQLSTIFYLWLIIMISMCAFACLCLCALFTCPGDHFRSVWWHRSLQESK